MFSYFAYAAAFINPEEEGVTIDAGLVGIALAVAPLVFVAVGFVSRNADAPRRILLAMGLLIARGRGCDLPSPSRDS